MIICIGREFGSGGHEIGKLTAEKLGISFYDRELIEAAAERFKNIPMEIIEKADEKKHNPWLYRVWYDTQNTELRGLSANEMLFYVHSQIIKELAAKENCIFVGRCSDFIMKKSGLDYISFFVAAPFQDRVKRKMELLSLDEKTATALVRKKDKERKAYYNYYTGGNWGKPDNYDFCINSYKLGIERTAQNLAEKLKEIY
ncbi:MAG: cytidylate kinase-like family protein [Lachnospiraceae bacterium]|nr:cytidylate kinase-like family protein [Lachnospiraceae bacterium]